MADVAFFGVGHMGGAMAQRLVDAGHRVWVFDLNDALVQAVVAVGALPGQRSEPSWRQAEFVISMLPHGAAVAHLYTGNDGIIQQLQNNPLLIDCSTVGPHTSTLIHHAAAERNLACIDAPVSGGVAGAQAGTLSFLCGGEAQHVDRARPMLSAMGKHILHAGGTGAGAIAKICNNLLLAIQMIGTSEALALGAAHGLNPSVLSDIMLKSSGRNWALEVYNPWPQVMENVPASRGYTGGFAVNLMRKDLGLAMEASEQTHQPLALGSLACQLYDKHAEAGHGLDDFSGIIQSVTSMIHHLGVKKI